MRIWWLGICFRFSENYAFEMSGLHKVCSLNEPQISVELSTSLHREYDHCPKVEFHVLFLWWSIISIAVFNIHHIEEHGGGEPIPKVIKLKCPECEKEVEFRFHG